MLTFIGVILYIQAGRAAVAAVTMIIWRDVVLDYLDESPNPSRLGTAFGVDLDDGHCPTDSP